MVRTLALKIKQNKTRLFWGWVAYQAVKGVLTTTFIWIPLLYWYVTGR